MNPQALNAKPGRLAYRLNSVLTLAIVLQWLAACSTVPITGRSQFTLINESQMISLAEDEYRKVLSDSQLADDTAEAEMVRRVGERIAHATDQFLRSNNMSDLADTFHWEFHLIRDDKTVNAWCMPGGKIAVYTGLLPIARDDSGLAVVLGHEVAHAVARHGNERLSQGLVVQVGAEGVNQALANKSPATRELARQAFGVGANVGFMLPYSRKHESEADHIGLILMAMAGYDPREAITFWERMAASGGGATLEILSTHPLHETRIQQIRMHLPEAMMYYRTK
ncbi:MAG: M48 family metallopeptidase [Candidatus Sumerlaeia bacterium]